MFFNSKFYTSVLELKSKTNIEWGFVIADKDFWDSVDSDNYGRDSLPLALDIPISNFVTPISKKANSATKFDPWESYKMGYYFESTLITNTGFPRSSFRSGVGGKLDCNVSANTFSVSEESSKVNLNPIVFNPVDSLSVTIDDIQDIIIDL